MFQEEDSFQALKLPDVPAVLIETAYISNADGQRMLNNNGFQKKLAVAVASSTVTYLSGTDSASIASAQDTQILTENKNSKSSEREKTMRIYTVRKGDTFFSWRKVIKSPSQN